MDCMQALNLQRRTQGVGRGPFRYWLLLCTAVAVFHRMRIHGVCEAAFSPKAAVQEPSTTAILATPRNDSWSLAQTLHHLCPAQHNVRYASFINQCICPPRTGCKLNNGVPCGTKLVMVSDLQVESFPSGCSFCSCVPKPLGQLSRERIIFATVPRSGNSWMRQLLEVATGVATESVFQEKLRARADTSHQSIEALWREDTQAFSPPCGRSQLCGRVRLSSPKEPVIVKTHWPFHYNSTFSDSVPDCGTGRFLLLGIRNPIDNFLAWRRYKLERKGPDHAVKVDLLSFLNAWLHHHQYWHHAPAARNVPALRYRFEDLHLHRRQILHTALHVSGLWNEYSVSSQSFEEALALQHLLPLASSSHISLEYLVGAWREVSTSDIQTVLSYPQMAPMLRAYGYDKLYEFWLRAHAMAQAGYSEEFISNMLEDGLLKVWQQVATQLYVDV